MERGAVDLHEEAVLGPHGVTLVTEALHVELRHRERRRAAERAERALERRPRAHLVADQPRTGVRRCPLPSAANRVRVESDAMVSEFAPRTATLTRESIH
jgi:hypothetical protein